MKPTRSELDSPMTGKSWFVPSSKGMVSSISAIIMITTVIMLIFLKIELMNICNLSCNVFNERNLKFSRFLNLIDLKMFCKMNLI